jgi:hypothetical protein
MYFCKLLIAYILSISLSAFMLCSGKSAEEWKSRIVYQILTDRFYPSDEVGVAAPSKVGTFHNTRIIRLSAVLL